ncbi:hypothetical protein [Crenobacter caeni]|uniref:Uncharacterized protein n=1 Tax=Crenobacter caeni TaxID=2705474 RepID=A0A6B2KPC8_9NEIS|nr:hypothetical protein [Crenobacter caeni]NDV11647.1 hypothetical protein [Crenobacter caeni]
MSKQAWATQAAGRVKALPAARTETKAERFRAIYPDIEAALGRGVSQAALVETLAQSGLVMTLDELRNALYRERKRLKKQAGKEPTHETQAPKAPRTPAATSDPAPVGHRPLDLGTRSNDGNTGAGFNWPTYRDQPTTW